MRKSWARTVSSPFGKFSVASNVGLYRTARHPYKINFQYGTKIKQCDDKFVPASIYVIGDPREIFQSQYDTDYLIGKLAKKKNYQIKQIWSFIERNIFFF